MVEVYKEVKQIINTIGHLLMFDVSPRSQPSSPSSGAPRFKEVQDTALKALDGSTGKPQDKKTEAEQSGMQALAGAWNVQNMEMANIDAVETVSMCQDPPDDRVDKTVIGILEGFDLLDGETEGSAILTEGEMTLLPDKDKIVTEYNGIRPEDNTETEPADPLAVKMLAKALESALGTQKAAGGEPQQAFVRSLENANKQEAPEEVPHEDKPRKVETALPEASARAEAPVQDVKPAPAAAPKQVAHAAPVSRQDMAENITNLIDKISTNANQQVKEFQVDLKPEFLGKLSIKLVMEGEAIHAQIRAADAASKGLIQAELPVLQETLKEKGILVTQIDVAYEASAFTFTNEQSQNQRQFSFPSKNKGYSLFSTDVAPYDTVMEAMAAGYGIIPEGSSVEFRA